MRVFEYKNGTSRKYWQIAVHHASCTAQYGRIGTKGRSNTKDFDTHEAAKKHAASLIAQKVGKGYIETSDVPELAFEDIYLVNNATTLVAPADIDALECEIGSLPLGYREFMHRCGARGSLCDEIKIWSPQVILDAVAGEREYMTYSHCMDFVKDSQGLEPVDFDEIWVFGSDGVGNNYCYFPRHRGVLFNLTEGGREVVRHESAFCKVSDLWCEGRVRHPFPYFAPLVDRKPKKKRSGFVQSFSFETSWSTIDIAHVVVNYWQGEGESVTLVEMPPQHDDDESDYVHIFIKGIDGTFGVSRDPDNHPGQILGWIGGGQATRDVIQGCLTAIEKKVATPPT